MPPGVAKPMLPNDFESLPEKDKVRLEDQRSLAMVHKYYEMRAMLHNPLYFASQVHPHTKYIIPPLLSASRTWYEGMHHLWQVLVDVQDDWQEIAPGQTFPITWDAKEIERHQEAYPRLRTYEDSVKTVTEKLQLEADGWVTNERYENVRRLNKSIVENWKPEELGRSYPFQDGRRSWFLS